MKYMKIQTNVPEVYFKLPHLNFTNEVIFSNQVPDISLKKIVAKFMKNGVELELIAIGDRKALIRKRGEVKFNTYLMNDF